MSALLSGFTQPAPGQQMEPDEQAAPPLQLHTAFGPVLVQASPCLQVAPSQTQRCEVVLQLTPEMPFAASHCAVVLHPHAPLKQANFETKPP